MDRSLGGSGTMAQGGGDPSARGPSRIVNPHPRHDRGRHAVRLGADARQISAGRGCAAAAEGARAAGNAAAGRGSSSVMRVDGW